MAVTFIACTQRTSYNHESFFVEREREEDLFRFRMFSSCALCTLKTFRGGHSEKKESHLHFALCYVGPLLL